MSANVRSQRAGMSAETGISRRSPMLVATSLSPRGTNDLTMPTRRTDILRIPPAALAQRVARHRHGPTHRCPANKRRHPRKDRKHQSPYRGAIAPRCQNRRHMLRRPDTGEGPDNSILSDNPYLRRSYPSACTPGRGGTSTVCSQRGRGSSAAERCPRRQRMPPTAPIAPPRTGSTIAPAVYIP